SVRALKETLPADTPDSKSAQLESALAAQPHNDKSSHAASRDRPARKSEVMIPNHRLILLSAQRLIWVLQVLESKREARERWAISGYYAGRFAVSPTVA